MDGGDILFPELQQTFAGAEATVAQFIEEFLTYGDEEGEGDGDGEGDNTPPAAPPAPTPINAPTPTPTPPPVPERKSVTPDDCHMQILPRNHRPPFHSPSKPAQLAKIPADKLEMMKFSAGITEHMHADHREYVGYTNGLMGSFVGHCMLAAVDIAGDNRRNIRRCGAA